VCTDINSQASSCTAETGLRNQVCVLCTDTCTNADELTRQALLHPVVASVLDGLRPRIDGAVDLLLFNPPYVVTTEEEEVNEQARASLGGAWAGGTNGTKILDTLIHDDVLSVRI